ncbi:pseudouridylate synthase 7 homolog [Bacillus rossius redtenbacheri]|uniref:pseudouridylate synthase 7 homolog n=1 Tax=Bacillus rossius redtenbacheri TaxID=93214 RepID=UPI002FDC9F73
MSYAPKKCLLEADVGITQYIGCNKGFSGIIKHRFSDFHVNEVGLDGSIIKLTDESIPDEILDSSDVGYKIDAVTPEVLLQLVELAMHGGTDVTIDVTDKSKDERREIHDMIRKKFPSKLVSNTKEKEGKKTMIVSKANKPNSDKRSVWPARRKGDFVHFVMYKENKDTMEVVNLIAFKLKMKPNNISYAGTKDRRAKTSQMLCVRKVEPARLASINKYLNGISLGNYVFRTSALRLGDLKGNHFRIAIRNVSCSADDLELALNSLKQDGFINYYGMQRFGSTLEVPTYFIGRALLLGDWANAIDLILTPRENETRFDVKAARKTWQATRNAEAAYEKLGKGQNTPEGKLLQGLMKNGSDKMGALNFIPRNLRLLYLHSYQSLVWNKIVSRRIKEFGLKPVVGDLVLADRGDGTCADSEQELGADAPDGEPAGQVEQECSEVNGLRVSVLTQDSVKDASMSDVVLPLPGYSVKYPENEVARWYEELLKADGLTSATMRQKAKSYSLAGTYRHLVKHPENLSWKTLRYSSPDDTLILSDLEQLRLAEAPGDAAHGKHTAVIVEFALPSSCYATMALRQAMRQDTSPRHAGRGAGDAREESVDGDATRVKDKRECDSEQSLAKKVKSSNSE